MNTHLRVSGKYLYPADVNSVMPPVWRYVEYERNVRIFWDAINGKRLSTISDEHSISIQGAAKLIKEMKARLTVIVVDPKDRGMQYEYMAALRRNRNRWTAVLKEWCTVYGVDASFMDAETTH